MVDSARLYTEFRAALKEKKLAYEGMILRDVVENLIIWSQQG